MSMHYFGRAVCTPAFGLPAKHIFHLFCKGKAWYTEGGKSEFREVKS